MNSPDFSSLISGILSNPEMLSGIMNAVSALGSSPLGSILQASKNPPPTNDTQKEDSDNDLFNNRDTTLSPASQSVPPSHRQKHNASDQKDAPPSPPRQNSQDRQALLYALKPFLGEKRGEKIDFILKVLALLDAADGFNKFKQ
jgi:hypothetical protein